MTRRTLSVTSGTLLLALAVAMTAGPSLAANPVPPGGGRVVLDAGWAVPAGDLDDGLDATPTGTGSRPGFEVGATWRFALARAWSLGPSVHFLGYGDATGLGDDGEETLAPTSQRYGLELMRSTTGSGTQWFAGLETAWVRSHLEGPGKDHVTLIEGSAGSLGLTVRAGVRFADTELSVVYHVNRFRSRGFFASGEELDYDWDSAVLRLGWRLP